ncbi:MAG: FHA domain-containing protein [Pseudomonadota bacterium]
MHPQEPHLAPIEVNETLFTIGRSEQAFAEFDKSLVARLSRRHAKLFEQDGAVYVADLNSRNGTAVNGQPVDAIPCRLADGDELEVGKLVFRIELEEAAADTVVDAEVTLILESARDEHDLTPIVVTRFPFLVSRNSEVFSRYLERAAKQVEFISAKHAHFYLQNGQVFVEDLNSTNGTLLNDVKVGEQPQVVRTGDLVALGGEFFEYRVRVLHADDSVDRTVLKDIDREQSSDGTIFVDSPTSFIDIFDTQDKHSVAAQPSVPSIQEFPEKSVERPPPAAAAPARQPARSGNTWKYVIGLVVLLGIGGAGYYYLAAQPSAAKLEQYLYSGDYVAGADMAKSLIASGVPDAETQRLATVVLLRAHIPAWLGAFNRGDMVAMAAPVNELRASGAKLPELYDYAQMLEWAAESRALLETSGASNGEMTRLRNWWVFNLAQRRATLDRLVAYVPAAQGLRESILTQARSLQSQ